MNKNISQSKNSLLVKPLVNNRFPRLLFLQGLTVVGTAKTCTKICSRSASIEQVSSDQAIKRIYSRPDYPDHGNSPKNRGGPWQEVLIEDSKPKDTRWLSPRLAKKEQAFLFEISSPSVYFNSIIKELIKMAGIGVVDKQVFLDEFSDELEGPLGPYYNLYCFCQGSGKTDETSIPRKPHPEKAGLTSEACSPHKFFILFLTFSLNLTPQIRRRLQVILEQNLQQLASHITIKDCTKRQPTLEEGNIKTRSLRSFRGAVIRLFLKRPLLDLSKTKIIAIRGTTTQFDKIFTAAANNKKLEFGYEPNIEKNILNQFSD